MKEAIWYGGGNARIRDGQKVLEEKIAEDEGINKSKGEGHNKKEWDPGEDDMNITETTNNSWTLKIF